MKRLITANEDINNTNDEEFVPSRDLDFEEQVYDTIIPQLRMLLKDKFKKKFRAGDVGIDVDDILVKGCACSMDISVWYKAEIKRHGRFRFGAYSDYWDRSDYESHLNRTINEFVAAM